MGSQQIDKQNGKGFVLLSAERRVKGREEKSGWERHREEGSSGKLIRCLVWRGSLDSL